MTRPITDPLRAALYWGQNGISHSTTCGELGMALEAVGRPDLAARLDQLMSLADGVLDAFSQAHTNPAFHGSTWPFTATTLETNNARH